MLQLENRERMAVQLHKEVQPMADHELLLAISNMLDTKLKAEFQALRMELHEEIQAVRAEVQTLKTEVQTLKEEMHRIKLYQENVIMPRINTIEACYTDTFKRYAMYVEKMVSTFQDVEMLKIVVAEHSEQLKKLA